MTPTPELKAKLRALRLGQKASPETREKQRQAKLGRKHTEAHNAAISAGGLRAWAKKNPIRIHKLSTRLKKLYQCGVRGEALRKEVENNGKALQANPNQLIAPPVG